MTQPQEDEEKAALPLEEELNSEPLGFDWPVFLGRTAGLVVVGAMLVTAVDLSFNRGLDWLDILRVSILPFSAGAALMLLAELLDRQGE
jgi:hypothetical protein